MHAPPILFPFLLFLLTTTLPSPTSAQTTPPGNCPIRSEAYCCRDLLSYSDPLSERRLQTVNLTPKRATRKHGGRLGAKCQRPSAGQCPPSTHPVCCKHKDFAEHTFLGCRSVDEAKREHEAEPKRVAEEAQQRGERAMKSNDPAPTPAKASAKPVSREKKALKALKGRGKDGGKRDGDGEKGKNGKNGEGGEKVVVKAGSA